MSARAVAVGLALAVALNVMACSGTVLEERRTGGALDPGSDAGAGACQGGRVDCNGDPADGCEADLDDDGHHCGACDRDCGGQACTDGACEPEVLVSGLYFARRLALDEARVYWTSADGTVNALPLAGGAPAALASGQDDPYDVTVDGAGVYWTDSGANTVMAAPLGGGLPALLADAGNPFAIVARGGAVYFTDTYSKVSNDEHVTKVPLPEGPATTIAATPGALMLAVDDERAYWTDAASDAVWSAPLGGGAPSLLASGVVDPTDIEVDEEAVYVNALDGTYRIALAGGPPVALVHGSGHGLAIDASHVYVGAADGRILRVSKAGGAASVLAKAALYPHDLAVGEDSVLWIHGGDEGALVRTPK